MPNLKGEPPPPSPPLIPQPNLPSPADPTQYLQGPVVDVHMTQMAMDEIQNQRRMFKLFTALRLCIRVEQWRALHMSSFAKLQTLH